jgi:hypothetical protein
MFVQFANLTASKCGRGVSNVETTEPIKDFHKADYAHYEAEWTSHAHSFSFSKETSPPFHAVLSILISELHGSRPKESCCTDASSDYTDAAKDYAPEHRNAL